MADGVVFLLAFVLFLVFAIGIPLWVSSDAQRHSPHSASLWALVAFFGGLLGRLRTFIVGCQQGAGTTAQY